MKKFKPIILSVFNWAIAALGLSAVPSCDSFKCEYGTPTMDFEVSGKVIDDKASPINGIKVTIADRYVESEAFTSRDGGFSYTGHTFPNDHVNLVFTDIDGEENGGEFKTDTVTVNLQKVKKGDGSWYSGKYAASDIEVVLSQKD